MSITRLNPNCVFLAGTRQQVNDLAAKSTITPGNLLERINTSGVIQWQKHSVAGGAGPAAFAIDHAMANKGVDDNYNAGDLVEVAVCDTGAVVWGFIASGQNIVAGNKLESAGDGTMRIFGSGTVIATALENKPNVVVLTRLRMEIST